MREMFMDKRDTAGEDPIPLRQDHKRMRLIWDVENYYPGDDCPDLLKGMSDVVFPAKYEVCSVCEGKGRYVNPDIDRNGLDPDHERDTDFMESYLNGEFDITCKHCGGDRVTLEIREQIIVRSPELEIYNLYRLELSEAWVEYYGMEAEIRFEQGYRR